MFRRCSMAAADIGKNHDRPPAQAVDPDAGVEAEQQYRGAADCAQESHLERARVEGDYGCQRESIACDARAQLGDGLPRPELHEVAMAPEGHVVSVGQVSSCAEFVTPLCGSWTIAGAPIDRPQKTMACPTKVTLCYLAVNMKTSLLGELAAEFLGTMVLILFGNGVVAMVNLFGDPTLHGEVVKGGYTNITLAWGLAVTMGIYVAGKISGAHLNPAVTLALAARSEEHTSELQSR